MSPRQSDPQRAHETEDQIVEAARDLLAEGGIAGLSMRQVAERVGVTATALYHYFENKEALVRRVVEEAFREFAGYLEAAAAPYPSGSLDRVQALGESYIRFATEHTAYFRVLFSIQGEDPHALEDLPGEGGYSLLKGAVAAAIASGEMRDSDPNLVALYCWCVAHGVMTIALACRLDACSEASGSEVPTTPLELFRAFRELMRGGIAASGGRPVSAHARVGEEAGA